MRIKICFKANLSPAERQRICAMLAEHCGIDVEEMQGCNALHFSSVTCVVEDIPLDHPRRHLRGVHGILGSTMHCLSRYFGRNGVRNYEISVSDAAELLSTVSVSCGKAASRAA